MGEHWLLGLRGLVAEKDEEGKCLRRDSRTKFEKAILRIGRA